MVAMFSSLGPNVLMHFFVPLTATLHNIKNVIVTSATSYDSVWLIVFEVIILVILK